MTKKLLSHNSGLIFIVLLGLVSLFADITYEGSRSITGQYLALLGANALLVGFVAGFGEFIGYGLRWVSGYIADRSGQYWLITIIGYAINLLAVPLLAFAKNWHVAAALIILERMGKAIRTPPRDAMLSYAGQQTGLGWGFGIHKALDQIGALTGPILLAIALYYQKSYQTCFLILLFPAALALITLGIAKYFFPRPQQLEIQQNNLNTQTIQTQAFWFYLIGACFIAAGFADFSLMAFYFEKSQSLPSILIPLIYAIAMGVNGITALCLGYLYDRYGFNVLIIVALFASCFAPLVFFGTTSMKIAGVFVWAIGVGTQDSLMRAIVAKMVPYNKRASAYGVFNMAYGISWFAGSLLIGGLYNYSIIAVVIFSVSIQLLSIPLLLHSRKFY